MKTKISTAPHLKRKSLQRLQNGAEKRVRRFMRLRDRTSDEGRRERYFKLASDAAEESADFDRKLHGSLTDVQNTAVPE
jgi:hypothetical protein